MKPDELTNGTKPVLKKQSRKRKEERKQQRMNDGNNDEFSAAKKKGKGGGTKEACLPSDVHVRHVLVCVCMYTITKSREEEKIALRINKMSEKRRPSASVGS